MIYLKEYIVNHSKEGIKLKYKQVIGKLMTSKYLSYRTAKEDVDGLINAGFCHRHLDEIYVGEEDLLRDVFQVDKTSDDKSK